MTMPLEPTPFAPRRVGTLATFVRRQLVRHRILRFLVVGGLNTLVGYVLFLAALLVLAPQPALCVATLLGVAFNFVSTGSYVFGSRDPRRLLRFYAVYAVTYVYNAVGLRMLDHAGVDPRVSFILLLPGAVTLTYLLQRRFVFHTPAA